MGVSQGFLTQEIQTESRSASWIKILGIDLEGKTIFKAEFNKNDVDILCHSTGV